ncbi:helix-turn-helix domain-containing protein [Aureimonas fodinaquatilis]|nr:XRE family transcriptional regulator [Aureimonas fodinaquatilis]
MSSAIKELKVAAPTVQKVHEIGGRLKDLRVRADITLATLARKSGISAATLSKIENNKVSPTFANLVRLASALEIPLTELIMLQPEAVAAPPPARISVTRGADINFLRTPNYELGALCTEIINKRINPLYNRILSFASDPNDSLVGHPGEEMVFVVKGSLELRTEYYQPITLEVGDCAYYDSAMPHSFTSLSPEPAEALVIWIPPSDLSLDAARNYVQEIFSDSAKGKGR